MSYNIYHLTNTLLMGFELFDFFLIIVDASVHDLGHFAKELCRIILRSRVFKGKGYDHFQL